MPRPQTPRRPTDDDPLRRTPARSTDLDGPAVRPRRLCDRNDPGVSPSRSRARGAVAAAVGAGTALVGFLKFLVFALVLAAIVLVIALTVLRPVVGGAVMSLAEDNPAALQLPFVKDIVAENLGDALIDPGLDRSGARSSSSSRRAIPRSRSPPGWRTRACIADRRTFVFIAIDRDLTGALQQGTFILRKNMTPDQLVSALLAPPPIKYVDDRAADRPAPRADHRQAPDAAADHGPAGVLRPGQVAAGIADRRLSVAQEDPRRRPEGRVARRASCGRRPIASSPRRRPRSSFG